MAKLWSQILFVFIVLFGHICALKFVKVKNIYGNEKSNEIENACSEKDTKNWFIYCQGPILEAVNVHNLFPDSKDFVDSPLRKSPRKFIGNTIICAFFESEETLKSFKAEFGNNSTNLMEIDVKRLKQFIEEYFDPPGSELAICVPRDWEERPQTLLTIEDNSMREWALELNGIWRKLCKKINNEIIGKMDRYSLIYVPNEFIAPGGRFREFYYWDAYWIIRGLIASEMYESAKKMIQNLAEMVKRFGMVPNGGRVYYLRRSQPPLLAPMLFEYFQHTLDWPFLYQMLPILEMEIKFWDLERQIKIEIIENGTTTAFGAYLYRAGSNVPRPESFKEDLNQSKGILDKEQRAFFFKSIASAAESGWDFSSRWLRDPQKLDTIETINILPVDLNSFICWNFNILEDLFMITKKYSKTRYYRNRKLEMQDLLELLFYNETTGVWHDYNLREQKHNTNFYPSIAMPLFTGCYDEIDERRSSRLFEYMKVNGAFNFDGGIPTSMIKGTGEQWDFPNGWSPLNHIIIEGLRKSENAEMEEQAFKLAKKWVLANYKVFKETKQMWEKYNVNGEAEPGTGGEYGVQDGFGWTNGVILDLLVTYRDRLSVESTPSMNNGANDANCNFGCKLAITIIFFTIFKQFLFKNHLFI